MQGRRATVEPQDRPPGLGQNSTCSGQRHGTTVGWFGDVGDTSRASLNRGRHSADTRKQEGQKQVEGMFPPPPIYHSAFRAAAEMSECHEGRGKTYNNSYRCRGNNPREEN